jgi:N-acetylglucosamine-6-sulfatase
MMKNNLVLLAVLNVALCATGVSRPNIVFILADDQRYDMMSCAGNPYAQTPHLDRIAEEGIRFNRAFTTCAVCMPSRATFMTGKQPHNAGAPTILHMPYTFHRSETTFTERLHDAGYNTSHFGKWHLGDGTTRQPGYDHWVGYYSTGNFFNPMLTINGKVTFHKGFTDFIVADLAAERIREVAKKDEPFFLYLGLKAPHIDFGFPEKYERIFDGIDIVKPASFREDYEASGKPAFMKKFIGVETWRGAIPAYGSWENYVKSYYRSSQSIDESVGKILAALDEAGVADDTLVIYASDHGYALGEHGLTEKHFAYEGTMRIPMLARYPKMIKPGMVRDELITNMDVAPTVLQLAGLDVPADVEGKSLRPFFEGKDVSDWREDVLYFLENQHQALRTDRYKLITYPGKNLSPELYDLENDPGEMVNRAADPDYASVLDDMQQRLKRGKEATGLTPRINHSVLTPCIIGPIPANLEIEVVNKAFAAGVIQNGFTFDTWKGPYTWRKIVAGKNGQLPIAEMVKAKGDERFLIGFQIEQLTSNDPFVRVQFSDKKARLRGWVDGELLYDRRAQADPGELAYNKVFNPPLEKGTNTLIFAGAVKDFLQTKIDILTWQGKTRLVD